LIVLLKSDWLSLRVRDPTVSIHNRENPAIIVKLHSKRVQNADGLRGRMLHGSRNQNRMVSEVRVDAGIIDLMLKDGCFDEVAAELVSCELVIDTVRELALIEVDHPSL
jgi:hypothetical protein